MVSSVLRRFSALVFFTFAKMVKESYFPSSKRSNYDFSWLFLQLFLCIKFWNWTSNDSDLHVWTLEDSSCKPVRPYPVAHHHLWWLLFWRRHLHDVENCNENFCNLFSCSFKKFQKTSLKMEHILVCKIAYYLINAKIFKSYVLFGWCSFHVNKHVKNYQAHFDIQRFRFSSLLNLS